MYVMQIFYPIYLNFLDTDIVRDISELNANMTVVVSSCLDQFGDPPIFFIAVDSFVIPTERQADFFCEVRLIEVGQLVANFLYGSIDCV